jgi:hypothetical protein
MAFRVFPECRSEQEWTTGKSKGESGKTVSYYVVCRAVKPIALGNGSVLEECGQVPILFIRDQLQECLRNVADIG